MTLEFRVLGELEARNDGQPLDIGHSRQRAVLALLLTDVSRVVTIDRIVDGLWPATAPQRAKETVYSYLSRLRKVLGAETIVRRTGGYALDVSPDAVDLHRFRSLVSRAHGQDVPRAQAAALFDEALRLWRGVPFEGIDTLGLDGLRTTLESERFAAELDRNDVRLALGEHANLLSGLQVLSGRHPLDERLCGQLMLALYRSGRQAEALETYDALRHRLAEELGSDPVPALRQLHHDILTAQAALDAAPAETPRTVPRQLPVAPRHFSARIEELAQLDDGLSGLAPVWVINGMGGIGKTWMALHWAHRHVKSFPDGQLYVNLRGFDPTEEPLEAAGALRHMLGALQPQRQQKSSNVDELSSAFRSAVADRKLLILLDNARDAAQVTPLLPGGGETVTIITSRLDLAALSTSHGAGRIHLEPLDEDDSYEALLGHVGAGKVNAEPEAVAEVLDHCRGLPLALGILASRATSYRHSPLTMLAEELRDDSAGLDTFDAGDMGGTLRAVFATSYRSLSPDASRVFDLMGLAPAADIGMFGIASLAGLPSERVRPAMRELESAHLTEQYMPGRYRMHDLVRAFAAERVQSHSESERSQAIRRFVDHYVHTAVAADGFLQHGRKPIDVAPAAEGTASFTIRGEKAAQIWFAHSRDNLLSAQRLAEEHGWHDRVWQLAWALTSHLSHSGLDEMRTLVWRKGVAATEAAGTLDQRVYAHTNLATPLTLTRQHEAAEKEIHLAMELAERSGDDHHLAMAHGALAFNYEYQQRFSDALQHGELAIAALYRSGKTHQVVSRLANLGWWHAKLGNLSLAEAKCRESIALASDRKEATNLGAPYHTLGYVAVERGELEAARELFLTAIGFYQRFAQGRSELQPRLALIEVCQRLNAHDEAAEHQRAAAALYRAMGMDDDAERILASGDPA